MHTPNKGHRLLLQYVVHVYETDLMSCIQRVNVLFLQNKQIRDRATPPMYLNCDLKTFDLLNLGTKFDVIHVTPPLEEYQRRASAVVFPWKPWEWEEIMALKLEDVSAQRYKIVAKFDCQ